MSMCGRCAASRLPRSEQRPARSSARRRRRKASQTCCGPCSCCRNSNWFASRPLLLPRQLPIDKLVYASGSARFHDCAIGGTTQRTPILTRLVAPRRPIILTGVSWQQARCRKGCRQQGSEVVPFGEKSHENEVLAP